MVQSSYHIQFEKKHRQIICTTVGIAIHIGYQSSKQEITPNYPLVTLQTRNTVTLKVFLPQLQTLLLRLNHAHHRHNWTL